MRPAPAALAFTVLGAVAGLVGCSLRPPRSAPPAPVAPSPLPPSALVAAGQESAYVGSEACKGCHAEIFRAHARSTHASTLHRVEGVARAAFQTPQRLRDPSRGVTYGFRTQDGKPLFTARHPSIPEALELAPDYVFGSGKIGMTYLVRRGDRFLEARASYYPSARRWAWTPGQRQMGEHPLGRPLDPAVATRCFLCHTTVLVQQEGRLDLERSRFNVRCERCHGPARDHVAAETRHAGTAAIPGHRAASAETIMRLCGECHSAPSPVPENLLERIPNAPRFAAPNLAASRCFRESGGRLSCLTCHDPHAPTSHDLAAYDRKCAACHAAAHPDRPCPTGKTTGCVSCHMPLKTVPFPIDRKFRTHLIKIYRDGTAPAAVPSPAAAAAR